MANIIIYEVSLLNDWDEPVRTWIANKKETANQIKEKVEAVVDGYRYRVEIFQKDIITNADSFDVETELGFIYHVKTEGKNTIIHKNKPVTNYEVCNEYEPTDMTEMFKNTKSIEHQDVDLKIEDMYKKVGKITSTPLNKMLNKEEK